MRRSGKHLPSQWCSPAQRALEGRFCKTISHPLGVCLFGLADGVGKESTTAAMTELGSAEGVALRPMFPPPRPLANSLSQGLRPQLGARVLPPAYSIRWAPSWSDVECPAGAPPTSSSSHLPRTNRSSLAEAGGGIFSPSQRGWSLWSLDLLGRV